jgi:hypothetical protein
MEHILNLRRVFPEKIYLAVYHVITFIWQLWPQNLLAFFLPLKDALAPFLDVPLNQNLVHPIKRVGLNFY